jgi:transcription antitermination factor NusA-like protein
MYKATVIPTNSQIFIPNHYIGKKIEVLVYTIDEISTENTSEFTIKGKPSEFIGCISKNVAKEMLHDIDNSRDEWNRSI